MNEGDGSCFGWEEGLVSARAMTFMSSRRRVVPFVQHHQRSRNSRSSLQNDLLSKLVRFIAIVFVFFLYSLCLVRAFFRKFVSG